MYRVTYLQQLRYLEINLNFIHRFTIMLIQMPRRYGHPVDLRTQFWQPWWYACVRVHHACYRLLIHSKITYLDVSSATSRGIQPSPRQKRDRRLSSRARWGLSILRSYLRAFAGNIVTRLCRRGRRSNYIRESRVYAVRRSINSRSELTDWRKLTENFHREFNKKLRDIACLFLMKLEFIFIRNIRRVK